MAGFQWTAPDSTTTRSAPGGLVFDPQKGVLTCTMPPGILRVEANATVAGRPGMTRQATLGVREPRALEVAFTSELRIAREGDFLAAYEPGKNTLDSGMSANG